MRKGLIHEIALGASVLTVSGVMLLAAIHAVASVKVTPDARRSEVCRDEGRVRATLFIEKTIREKQPIPETATFSRDDAKWAGDCNFIMQSRVRTEHGPVGFVASVSFDPETGAWHLNYLNVD